jgi:hypothetical protein
MKKLVAGVLLLVIVAAAGSAYVSASSSPTVEAQLHVEDGSVAVNGTPAAGTVTLAQADVVKTAKGHATIILHESVLVLLEPDTEVSVADLLLSHPRLTQLSGTTWNTFTKLSGVSSYSIKQGTTVATVRGTKFEFSNGLIFVTEGAVEYTLNGQVFIVTGGRAVQNGVERAMTAPEIARAAVYRQRTVQELRHLRQLEMEKHPILLSLAKQTYFRDDEARMARVFEEADNSRIDVDAQVAKAPARPVSLRKIAAITKTIQAILRE